MYQFLNLRSFDLTQHTLYGSAISLSQLNIYEFPIQAMALLCSKMLGSIGQPLCHVHYSQHRAQASSVTQATVNLEGLLEACEKSCWTKGVLRDSPLPSLKPKKVLTVTLTRSLALGI